MTGRGRGTTKKVIPNSMLYDMNNEEVNNLEVYLNIMTRFADAPNDDILQMNLKEIYQEAINNPLVAIATAKYIFLFDRLKTLKSSNVVKKSYLNTLESGYKEYTEGGSVGDPETFRNFTYFFAVNLYFNRLPGGRPQNFLISALLILLSKLDIMENFQDAVVYSKALAWLSIFFNVHSDSVISNAYNEALNRLRELFSMCKGSSISLACFEKAVNGGILSNSGIEFYRKSTSKFDFQAVESNLSITVPIQDQDKFLIDRLSHIIFV